MATGTRQQQTARSSLPHPKKAGELCGDQIGALLQRLKHDLQELNRDVKEEENGKEELRVRMEFLEREHSVLQREFSDVLATYNRYETSSKAFEEEHSAHVDFTHRHYGFVRVKHREALDVISRPDTFGYHQAYRRHGDNFGGLYFTPPPLKKVEEKTIPSTRKVERLVRSSALPPVSARAAAPPAVGAAGAAARP
mmetsp:Transcript_6309/g.15714  ORF Transcript_6309/g.15714 Transcript_6309/m.15714 type:complete len:196 (-) Transcript_6309:104-691(-)